ncbi:MAG: DUF5024 domain-containing protein [Dysgonamonadaceae bacterium]|jgi:hypothetical protein|nr:DUF5024 domain-containing protein [Dysgonamonadaceae bacterium]
MRKKICIAIFLLTIFGISIDNVTAQENIAELLKKCERSDSTNVSIIHTQNPRTNESGPVATTVTIRSNPGLIKEFLKAFENDREKAAQSVMKEKGGKRIYAHYEFDSIFYTFEMKGENEAKVMAVKKGFFHKDLAKISDLREIIVKQKAELVRQKEKINKEALRQKEKINREAARQKEKINREAARQKEKMRKEIK